MRRADEQTRAGHTRRAGTIEPGSISPASPAARAGTTAGLCLLSALVAAGCGKPDGPHRPWIHKVRINGAKQVKAGDVSAKLAAQQSSWFPLAPKKYLDHPFIVEVDRERIEAYYKTRGFFGARSPKATITPYKLDPDKDPKAPEAQVAVDVTFEVEEGKPTYVDKFEVSGLEVVGGIEKLIPRGLPIEKGQIFEHARYLAAREGILTRLKARGHAFATVAGQVRVNREARTAEVLLIATPGKKVRLGKVTVKGAEKTDAGLLAKHVALKEGEDYKPETLEIAQGKLYSLGLFSTVRVEPVADPKSDEVADVEITLTEGPYREVRVGVGVGIEPLRNEVHTEARFIKRRFLGGLRSLETNLTVGYAALPAVWADPIYKHGPILGLKVDFTQPDLLGKNSSLTATLGYEVGIEYAYQYHGPGLRVGINKSLWRDRIKLGFSYNFQFLDFFNIDKSIESDPSQSGSLFGFVDPYRLAFFQELIALDLRNRTIDATRGFYLSLTAEQGGVYTGSAFTYQKFLPEARGYYTIAGRVTLAARIQFGQILTQGDLGSPITQRFYLGGPNSHRGFTYNRLSYQTCSATPLATMQNPYPLPQRVGCSVGGGVDNSANFRDFRSIPIGGDQLLLGQLEVRVNLFKLLSNWFSLAAFVDAGDVAAPAATCNDKGCSQVSYLSRIDLTKLHVAVGGGLRYRTVIGSIRFDLGVRLNRLDPVEGNIENPDPGARIAYHISIGEAF